MYLWSLRFLLILIVPIPTNGFLMEKFVMRYPLPLLASAVEQDTQRSEAKRRLLDLIAGTPSNMPASKSQTDQILGAVRELECVCPTKNGDVVETLGGNWELLWTAQDQSSDEWGLGPLRTWIK